MVDTTGSLEKNALTRESQILTQAMIHRTDWEVEWRDLARYILPYRYSWLTNLGRVAGEHQRTTSDRARQRYILDSTATKAARTCAAGMMNGITSPARPWVNFRIEGVDENDVEVQTYLDKLKRMVMRVMSESNFYNCLAVFYMDLVTFGTASALIYEDSDEVIRCYNSPVGEFALIQDETLRTSGFAREFEMSIQQVGDRFGRENLSPTSKVAYDEGGARAMRSISICHLIEKNHEKSGIAPAFNYVEYYWEKGKTPEGKFLGKFGYYSKINMSARWEVNGTETYGIGPGHDALSDTIQLQHETKRKAQGIDLQVKPPMIADSTLAHRPVANTPGGITFVAPTSNVGMRAAYQTNINLQDLKEDIREVQMRIREAFYNDLFKMITQLDTVRSATEIDARREEKLVLLGPVLERVENEALDVAIRRIVDILERWGLAPERPEAIRGAHLDIEYVSILADAQRAVATIGVERFLQFIAGVAGLKPEIVNLPNFEVLARDYARSMGITGEGLRTIEQYAASVADEAQRQQLAEGAELGATVAQGAEALSKSEVGGGANALQMMIGGG